MKSTLLRGISLRLPLKVTFCMFLMGTLTGCLINLPNPVECDYYNDVYNDSPSIETYSKASWSCDEDLEIRTLTANGIPNHPTKTYYRNGSWADRAYEQKIRVHITTEPELTKEVKPRGGVHGALGYALNGVKIDPGSGGTCPDKTDDCMFNTDKYKWNIDTLGQTFFNYQVDENNGHLQPDGAYHYHGLPHDHVKEIELRKQKILRTDMILFGWALDGHAIYAEYGSKYDHTTRAGYRKMESSYRLVETVSDDRPSLKVYPLGTFKEDWEYKKGSGDLDECNGLRASTAYSKDMQYHYIATEAYPYVPPCVKGYLDFPIDLQPPSANREPPAHR